MPIQDWSEIVTAVGIDVRQLGAMEVYGLEGKIIHDPELTKRAEKFLEGPPYHRVMPKNARTRAIREMSPTERLALRDRVLGVHVMGKTA
jgi:hypothetical protein